MNDLTKAHFFAYILNTPLMIALVNSYDTNIINEIISEALRDGSPLSNLLIESPHYPFASQLREESQSHRPADTGGKKRTLRNNNSKSYSKKTKNKNKNNKKTRRSRFSKK
jgi:hypothetical protein